jgi:hypothetical protein
VKRTIIAALVLVLLAGTAKATNLLERLKEYTGRKGQQQMPASSKATATPAVGDGSVRDEATVSAGLKEALTIGSRKAVVAVSKENGYFGNPVIRIPLPEKVQGAERTLRMFGLGKQVDEFVLTMNRAAERAAPAAKDIFVGAVKEMTIVDAMQILRGSDTSATAYLRSKTYPKLYGAFKPTVSKAVMDVGVTKAYQSLVDEGKELRLIEDESMDLDHHVTSKALDGLFYMLGQEEKKIRKDPVARVTDLLKTVFGK